MNCLFTKHVYHFDHVGDYLLCAMSSSERTYEFCFTQNEESKNRLSIREEPIGLLRMKKDYTRAIQT